MYVITLYLDQTGWHAHHTDPRVRRAFGVAVLPCGFGASTNAATVVARMRELNPDCEVRLGACPRPAMV